MGITVLIKLKNNYVISKHIISFVYHNVCDFIIYLKVWFSGLTIFMTWEKVYYYLMQVFLHSFSYSRYHKQQFYYMIIISYCNI